MSVYINYIQKLYPMDFELHRLLQASAANKEAA
jgi:hypothetical protein